MIRHPRFGRTLFPGQLMNGAIYSYATDGLITLAPGLHKLTKVTAAALTLAVPVGLPDGLTIRVRSTTAAAHVVTVTGGFGGVGATRDTATFTAEVGAGFTALVVNGLWHLQAATLVAVA